MFSKETFAYFPSSSLPSTYSAYPSFISPHYLPYFHSSNFSCWKHKSSRFLSITWSFSSSILFLPFSPSHTQHTYVLLFWVFDRLLCGKELPSFFVKIDTLLKLRSWNLSEKFSRLTHKSRMSGNEKERERDWQQAMWPAMPVFKLDKNILKGKN